jgi:hypothetical protein
VLKRFVTPRWLGWHALVVLAVVVLARIGSWQWAKGGGDGRAWQHYGYGLQWFLFAAFAVFLWGKLVLDELDPGRVEARQAQVDARPPVVQRTAPPPADDEDDELAAYNRRLAELARLAESDR